MNLALVIPGGGGGGVRSVLRIATGLMQRGHNVTVFHREEQKHFKDAMRRIYHAVRFGRGRGWLDSFGGKAVPYRHLTTAIVGTHDAVVGVGVSCVLEVSGLSSRCGVKQSSSTLGAWVTMPWRTLGGT